jgi:hypothetical protein
MYVYCKVVLVFGDPLCSYRGHNHFCHFYIICASVRLNSVQCSFLPSEGIPWNSSVQPSDITHHLVAVRGTPTWECDRTDVPKVYIRNIIEIM